MDIGELTGQVSLEDQVKDQLTQVASQVKDFLTSLEGGLGLVAAAGVSAAVALAGVSISVEELTRKIVDFAAEGDKINGVTNAFNNLAAAAGNSGQEIVEGLSKGVQGTVTQFQLMQDSVKLVGSGIKLTTEQATTLGQAARELGKAMGTDASQGLEVLNQALTTGKSRMVERYGIVVDTKKAEADLAAQYGVSANELSKYGKLQADQTALLAAYQAYLDKVGVSQLTFTEKINQAKTAISEWWEELYKGVADSPQVNAALASIEDALAKAFGTETKTLQQNIIDGINTFADVVKANGPAIIKFFGDLLKAGNDLVLAVKGTWHAIPDWLKEVGLELSGIKETLTFFQHAPAIIDMLFPETAQLRMVAAAEKMKEMQTSLDAMMRQGTHNVLVFGDEPPAPPPAITKDQSAQIQKLADQYDFVAITKQATELGKAFTLVENEGNATADVILNFVKAAQKMAEQGATLPSELSKLVIEFGNWGPVIKDAGTEIDKLGIKLGALTLPIESVMAELNQKFIVDLAKPIQMFGTNITQDFDRQTKELIKSVMAFHDTTIKALINVGQSFLQFGAAVGGSVGSVISDVGKMATAGVKAFHDFDAAAKAFATNTGAAIADIASGILSIGASIVTAWSNVTSKTQGLISGAMTGATAGAAIGTFFGPGLGTAIGAGIGAVAGGITGFIKGIFGQAGRDAVTQFAAQFADPGLNNGFDNLHKQLLALGSQGEQLWIQLTQGTQAGNATQAAANIALVTKALNDAKTAAANFNTALSPIISQIAALGGNITSSLLPALEQSGQLTAANAAAIAALSATATPTYDQLTALQKKYNLTAAEMGSAFQTAQINAQFQTLADDLDEFARGNINVQQALFDTKGALTGLGTAIQTDIQQAIDAGVSIPENFRTVAQSLITAGDLVDANGKKITDISQLQFAPTLETTLQKLNDTLDLLIKNFLHLGDTINGIPNSKDISVNVTTHSTTETDKSTLPDNGGETTNTPAFATGGRLTRPIYGLVGDAPETIIPDQYIPEFARLVSSSMPDLGDGMEQTIMLKIGEDVLLEHTAKGMQKYLQLMAGTG